jgi:cis-3-alkyl-4-acyloxetan-2-one decarboxylase
MSQIDCPSSFRAGAPLPSWLEHLLPFERRVVTVDSRSMHCICHGQGRPVLLLHGNPTWSFLWRKVIAGLDPNLFFCVAPDLFGLGLSDKPARIEDHSLAFHAESVAALVHVLGISDLILVGQDWGGPIGCAAAVRLPGRVTGIVMGNTGSLRPRSPIRSTAFHRFSHVPLVSDFVFRVFNFPVPFLHRVQGNPTTIRAEVARAYRYPLRRIRDRIAPLALARMVPNREDHPSMPELEKVEGWVRAFAGPAALVWGVKDPILGRGLSRHRQALPHAVVMETEAGHFLQEEVPEKIAQAIVLVSEKQASGN